MPHNKTHLPASDYLASLRIIDANFNRAREGLRVVEEQCRFVLGDRHLTERCKLLRHELTMAISALPQEHLLSARETQADVGTTVATPSEARRDSLAEIYAANWRRVQQALRAMEEFAKLICPELAATSESLRYRAYTLAKACKITADSQNRLQGSRLYVLIDGGTSESDFAKRVGELVAAGVHVIQLRDKTLDDRSLLTRARLLRRIIDELTTHHSPLTTHHSLPLFIVNDRPDLAVLARADGVHLGQDELTVHDARQIVGADMLIGISTHNIQQARQAVLDGANYLGCGPVFPSGTKHFDQFPGLDFLRQVAAEIALPAFAIGGITLEKLPQVVSTGFTRVAVGGAVASAAVGSDVASRFLTALDNHN
jgi:thiamine-phosphate pyrophosphorylase